MTQRKKARKSRFKTLDDLMRESASELRGAKREINVATITETAIDLPPVDGMERGFVVQMYNEGFLREAWFFIDHQRCPLPSDIIEAALAAADDSHEPAARDSTS